MFNIFENDDELTNTQEPVPEATTELPDIDKDKLMEDLSPREKEIIDSVIVDGYEDREREEQDAADDDYINSIILDDLELEDGESFLNSIGMVDPDRIEGLELDKENLDRLTKAMNEVTDEIVRLESAGLISKEKAMQIDTFLHGRISDTIAMESFTQLPTKTNHKLVLEELNQNQAAMATGGVIIGGFVLYKLIKWLLNAFNKNSAASSSISDNVKAILERGEKLRHANVDTKELREKAIETLKESKNGNIEKSVLDEYVKAMRDVNGADLLAILPQIASNKTLQTPLWHLIFTGKSELNGNAIAFSGTPTFSGAVKKIVDNMNIISGKVGEILESIDKTDRGTALDGKVIGELDRLEKEALDLIKVFGINANNTVDSKAISQAIFDACSGLTKEGSKNYVLEDRHANIYSKNLEVIGTGDTFLQLNTNIENADKLAKTLQDKKIVNKVNDMSKGWTGTKPNQTPLDDKIKASYVNGYNRAAQAFSTYVRVLSAIRLIQSNYGKGLIAIRKALDDGK